MRLRTRVSLSIVGFMSVVSVVVAVAVTNKYREEYRVDFHDWSGSLTAAVSRAVFKDVTAGDYRAVGETLREIARENHNIRYLLLLDSENHVFAATDESLQVAEISRQAGRGCKTGNSLPWQFAGRSIQHICNPLAENLDVQLHVGFDDSHLGHFFRQTFAELWLVLLPIFTLAIVAGFVVAARVSRSLQLLATSVQAYGQSGALPEWKPSQGETEISQLHASIVDMVADRNSAAKDLRLKDAAVTHSLNAIALADLEGKLVYVNPAFLRLWGYEREDQVLGRPATEFWLNQEEAVRVVDALMTVGYWQGQLHARRHGDGEFIASLSAVMLRDEQDVPNIMLASFLDVTQQQRAEQVLQEHVERLQEAQRIGHIGSWELDLVANQLHWSDEIFRIFEIDPQKFGASYEAFLNAIHPDDRDVVNKAYTNSLATRTPYEIIHRLQMADGRIKYVHERCESFFDAAGKPLMSKGTVQDITQRRQAELDLQALAETLELRVEERTHELEAERNFIDTVLDIAGALVVVLDTHGHIVRFNRACEEATGFTSAELRDTPIWETLIPLEERAAVQQVFQNLTGSALPSRGYENHWLTKDGRRCFIAWSNSVMKDDQGRVEYVIGTGIDITARRQAEQALAESERNLRLAQKIAHVGHWRANLQSGELSWSEEIYRIFGRDPARFEPSVENFYACVHPDDLGKMKASDSAALTPGGKLSIDHRIVLPGGGVRWVHEEAEAEFDAEGRPLYLTGTVQDITARKQVEDELVAAKVEAERANHAKSDFLSRMSHELRTPMNAILGFSQLLELESLQEEQQHFVGEIYTAGKHLLELINELLDLSRIESGRLVTVVQPVELDDVVQQAVQIVSPLLAARDLTLVNECANGGRLLADKMRLKQVLVNLLSNAIKYNRDGGRITIHCWTIDSGEMVRLSVTDTGMGIGPEHQPNLFVPFERLGAEFTEIEGTGIGLALCKQIIEHLGGRIGAESTRGAGSTFWFELPVAAATMPTDEKPRVAQPAAGEETRQVLYIEDNAANLRLVQAMFRHRPRLALLSATNGEFGLELARRYRPNVILLDIQLPGISGYQVLEALRASPDTRDIPVIALSADAMPLDVEKGLAAGFSDYLTKPVSLEILMTALDEALAVGASA